MNTTAHTTTATARVMWLLPLFLLLCLRATSQPLITPVEPGSTAAGTVYYLPKTVFNFRLLVEKRSYTPGQFAKYAEKYMFLTGIEQEPQVTHNVVDVAISLTGVRDTSKCYAVTLKGGKCETAELKLSDDGVLTAVNDQPATLPVLPHFTPALQAPAADQRKFIPIEILSAGSTAKMAELTAQLIFELQEHRQQLVAGVADDMPQDEQQLRYMVEQMDRQHEALMQLFTGTVRCDTTEHTLSLCPDSELDAQVLFRLSRKRGLVDADDLSGVPYYLTLTDVDHEGREKHPLATDGKKTYGFYVNMPGRVRLTLQREQDTVAAFTLPAAQFGYVTLRDGQLFKRYTTRMRLDPATGAVSSLRAETDTK